MISVIMLTYNREQMVERAICSILTQTFQEWELILVDNGSTDQSGTICDHYARKDPRVKVLHKEKGNIGSGRNAGLKLASGDYITFIDDDDWCDSDFLACLYDLAKENEAEVSICGAFKEEEKNITLVGVTGDKRVMSGEDAVVALMWRKLYNTGFPTKLILRDLFQELRFSETGQYDDISLMYKILAGAKTVAFYGTPKYHVRRHRQNNSLATTKDAYITPEYLAAYREAYRERTEWLCKRFPSHSDDWRYFDWSFQISMLHKIFINGLKDNERHFYEMRKELLSHKKEFLDSPNLQAFEKAWMEEYV